ncbi:hypothetical protein I302_106341 [Kwoniella bestiolae CBS 10118]|uniref:Uncharacterized protein n=1 Tax=Kwoniella bestiolae CBS 10118 TaxID=1296100 RepID=A0A1B9G3Q5_9TREE|nr:hypothetical protein I302_05465 [Kwoniella bestiolae CBS 10118]OCF25641.1 hypothetical protein I302_05465 [Kwoniella bestiolae CBS 10118]
MFSSSFLLLPLLAGVVSATPIKRYDAAWIVSAREGKCLGVKSPAEVGSAVESVNCTTAEPDYLTKWDINPGSGSVILFGTGLALDAGSVPGNNGALKVWTSYPTLYQQTWYLTADNRIAITGGDQCLDQGDEGIQTYECTTGNTNQVFNISYGLSSWTSSVAPTEPKAYSALSGPVTVAVGSVGPAPSAASWSVGPATTVASGSIGPAPSNASWSVGPESSVVSWSTGPAPSVISGSVGPEVTVTSWTVAPTRTAISWSQGPEVSVISRASLAAQPSATVVTVGQN